MRRVGVRRGQVRWWQWRRRNSQAIQHLQAVVMAVQAVILEAVVKVLLAPIR